MDLDEEEIHHQILDSGSSSLLQVSSPKHNFNATMEFYDDGAVSGISFDDEQEDTDDELKSESSTSSPVESCRSLSFELNHNGLPRWIGTMPPSQLSHYKLGRTLGEGAFAKVKIAQHEPTGMRVAIKLIYKDAIKEDYVRRNLHREGQLMARLNHQNIIQLYETLENDEVYCVVTELAEGGELLDYIVAHKALPEREVKKYIWQLVSAVEHMHAMNVVHRDLKAENLLLDNKLNIKIIDFGLGNDSSGTSLRTQCGSPAYGAPELIGGKSYGKEVDVWSIGINMYAMLTGKLPFPSNLNTTKLHALMLEGNYKLPENLSEDGLDALRKMLKVKPKDRITISELKQHPWLKEFGTSNNGVYSTPIDNEVVMSLIKLGYDGEEIIEALEAGSCNEATAMYKLMYKRHMTPPPKSASKAKPPLKRVQSDTRLLPPSQSRALSPRLQPLKEDRRRRNSIDQGSVRARRGSFRRTRHASSSLDDESTSHSSEHGRLSHDLRLYSEDSTSRSPDIHPSDTRSKTRFARRSSHEVLSANSSGTRSPVDAPTRRRSSGTLLPLNNIRSAPVSASRQRRQTLTSLVEPEPTKSSTKLQPPTSARRRARSFRRSNTHSCLPRQSTDSSVEGDIDMLKVRTLRFPLSRKMISHKMAHEVLSEVQRAAHLLCTNVTETLDGLVSVAAQFGTVALEMEVVRVPGLKTVHGVHFSRVKGEGQAYSEACQVLLQEMDL